MINFFKNYKNKTGKNPLKLHRKRHWILITLAVIIVVGIFLHWLTTMGTFVDVDKTVEKSCLAEVKDKKFCKFAAHVKKMGDYKLTLKATTTDVVNSYEVSGSKDGNIQMAASTNGKEVANIVVFNNTSYAEDLTDSTWIKYGPNAANKPDVFDIKKEIGKNDFKSDKGQKYEYKNLGKEGCGNMSCYKYQIIDTQNTVTKTFVLFDDLQFLLRSLTSSDNTGSSELTMSYETVSIVQPAPVKQTIN